MCVHTCKQTHCSVVYLFVWLLGDEGEVESWQQHQSQRLHQCQLRRCKFHVRLVFFKIWTCYIWNVGVSYSITYLTRPSTVSQYILCQVPILPYAHIQVPYQDATHHYIVAQGPLEHTCADFWQMIWEKRIQIVVMLTNEWVWCTDDVIVIT